MEKSGQKDIVYVGSWDSVARKMKYTCAEKGQAFVQLERDPSTASFFRHVCLEEHVPPDLRRKSSEPLKVVFDHAVQSDVTKGLGSLQSSGRSSFKQDKPFEPPSGCTFSPKVLRSSMGKISNWKKWARKGPLSETGGSAKTSNGEGKGKADLVAAEGKDGCHRATKIKGTTLSCSEGYGGG